MKAPRCIAILSLLTLALPLRAAENSPDFIKEVRPLLEIYCFGCHGPEKKKGGVDLASIKDLKSALKQRKLWRTALTQVESREMPPEDAVKLPTGPEREVLQRWLKHVTVVDCSNQKELNPGPALIHRLNRSEYDLTIRELMGIEFDSGDAVGMPDDSAGHGYANQINGLILPPVLLEKYFAAADLILERIFTAASAPPEKDRQKAEQQKKLKAAYDRIMVAKPGNDLAPRDAARKIAEAFAKRAYRRPVQPPDLERALKLFDLSEKKKDSFDIGIRAMLKAMLVSPSFLFRIEEDRAPKTSNESYAIGDYELASRLSYFLWSSMPDVELFMLAEQKKLSDPAILAQQTKRMLADKKAEALTTNFAARWLQIHKLDEARPSTEFFPTFTQKLRQAMYDETATFINKLRAEDRSVLELLDADYTYVNQDLAKHYGIEGVTGAQMQRVALKPEHRRGGLLGMAGVLALTSHTSRTSPTLRGKWILEVVFGTPPPPPPPDAGTLKEDDKKEKEPKTFREKMAMHATQSSCAGCHKKIDPLGFGLENYDAIGSWRDNYGGGRPLDNSGQLPTGEKFNGVGELKKVILQNRDQFVRNLSEQALTYALGRELEYYDECAVNEIMAALKKDDYKFSALIAGVVKSHPFQHRRNTDAAVDGAE